MMRGLIILGAALLAGCASVEPTVSAVEKNTPAQDRLSPVTLSPGECGLFVWTADADKRFILFSQSRKASGRWLSKGRSQDLSIDAEDGIFVQGQYSGVVFKTGDGQALSLMLGEHQTISDGTRFKYGVLKHKSGEGWERVTPVVGLAACQS